MNLEILDFINKKHICENHNGENISPSIRWTLVENAQSYAIILEDPDAVSGNFVHWYIPYICPELCGIDSLVMTNCIGNVLNKSRVKQGKNSLGQFGYHGPCAPKDTGIHHYIFIIYALNGMVDITKYKDISGSKEFESILKNSSIKILERDSCTFKYSYGNM